MRERDRFISRRCASLFLSPLPCFSSLSSLFTLAPLSWTIGSPGTPPSLSLSLSWLLVPHSRCLELDFSPPGDSAFPSFNACYPFLSLSLPLCFLSFPLPAWMNFSEFVSSFQVSKEERRSCDPGLATPGSCPPLSVFFWCSVENISVLRSFSSSGSRV